MVTSGVLVLSVFFLWPATQAGGRQVPAQVPGTAEQAVASPTAVTTTPTEPQVTAAQAATETSSRATAAPADDHAHGSHPEGAAHDADCAKNHNTPGSDHYDCSGDHTHGSDDHAHGSHPEGAAHDADCAKNHNTPGSDHYDCTNSGRTNGS